MTTPTATELSANPTFLMQKSFNGDVGDVRFLSTLEEVPVDHQFGSDLVVP